MIRARGPDWSRASGRTNGRYQQCRARRRVARESVFERERRSSPFAGARRLYTQALVEVDRVAGTTMRARVDPGGVYLSASPGLHWSSDAARCPTSPSPDIRVRLPASALVDVPLARGLGRADRRGGARGLSQREHRTAFACGVAPSVDYSRRRTDPDLAGTDRWARAHARGLGTSGTASVGAGAALPPELADGVDLAVSLDLQMSGVTSGSRCQAWPTTRSRSRPAAFSRWISGRREHRASGDGEAAHHGARRGVLIAYAKPGLMALVAHFDVTAMLVRPVRSTRSRSSCSSSVSPTRSASSPASRHRSPAPTT